MARLTDYLAFAALTLNSCTALQSTDNADKSESSQTTIESPVAPQYKDMRRITDISISEHEKEMDENDIENKEIHKIPLITIEEHAVRIESTYGCFGYGLTDGLQDVMEKYGLSIDENPQIMELIFSALVDSYNSYYYRCMTPPEDKTWNDYAIEPVRVSDKIESAIFAYNDRSRQQFPEHLFLLQWVYSIPSDVGRWKGIRIGDVLNMIEKEKECIGVGFSQGGGKDINKRGAYALERAVADYNFRCRIGEGLPELLEGEEKAIMLNQGVLMIFYPRKQAAEQAGIQK